MTDRNVIYVLKGRGLGGGGALGGCTGDKAFLFVTDNRRSRPNYPFCEITQHRKFEFGHHRQTKKISNAQELTMQLSQTLSSAVVQIEILNSPITNHTKRSCPRAGQTRQTQTWIVELVAKCLRMDPHIVSLA